MAIVTIKELREALRCTLGRKGMPEEQIIQLADYIMSFFGFSTEVIDNVLEANDRDVFYMLEEEGILGTRQEEVFITKGKLWRIHYWVLKPDRIKRLIGERRGSQLDEYSSIYARVSEEAWTRH